MVLCMKMKGTVKYMSDIFSLCAFADEATPAVDGQIRALTENGIGLIELRGVDGKNVAELTASFTADLTAAG